MGKNIKSYATIQVHFPWEREGSLMAKGPNLSFTIWYGLTVHIIRFSNYKQNFQNCLPQSNSSELHKFRAVRPHSPRILQNSHILHYVSDTCPGREPCKIPANYANSAQFAHTVRKFHKIRTFYIMFQTPAPAENPTKFQRITQIPRNLPTQSTNYAKFAPFANTTPYVSDA